MLEYFRAAGFKNVRGLDLKNIMELQKKEMPFRKRIAYNYTYHLVYGEKIEDLKLGSQLRRLDLTLRVSNN